MKSGVLGGMNETGGYHEDVAMRWLCKEIDIA